MTQTMTKTCMPRVLIAALLALALSACGFHLRNALVLPAELSSVRVVSGDPYSPLAESLAEAIERAGAAPTEANVATTATLEVQSERWGNTPISIDQFGRAQEFSLRYAVVFALRRPDGSFMLAKQAVELSRDYVASPTDLIGSESEREILTRELRRDMSAAILRRVGAFARLSAPTP